MGSFLSVRAEDMRLYSRGYIYYDVKSWYFNQANQVDYEKGSGTINYIVQLKCYGFEQVTVIVWVKFFPFKEHFSFLSLIAM